MVRPASSPNVWRGALGLALAPVLGVLIAGCGAGAEPAEPPPNPVEERLEPVRQRAAEADSLMRARERAVDDLSGQE